jgi:hypothetical protein
MWIGLILEERGPKMYGAGVKNSNLFRGGWGLFVYHFNAQFQQRMQCGGGAPTPHLPPPHPLTQPPTHQAPMRNYECCYQANKTQNVRQTIKITV